MSRESILVVLAVFIIVSPYVGLPLAWLSWILPVLGLFVLIIGVSLRRERKARSTSESSGTF